MVSIQEAQQSVLRAREQATQAEAGISKYEQALPKTTTQQSLRQKIGAGLKGMLTRKKVTQAKEQAQKARGQVQQFKEGVSRYEKEVSKAEAKQREYEKYKSKQAGYKAAEEFYYKGIPADDPRVRQTSPYARAYLEKMYKRGGLMESGFQEAQLKNLTSQGFKPVYDGGKLVGFEDPYAQQSVGLQHFEEHMERYESPQVAYKDMFTGEISAMSIAPGNVPPTMVPIVLDAKGRELTMTKDFKEMAALSRVRPDLAPVMGFKEPERGIKFDVPELDRTGQIYDSRTGQYLTPTYGLGAGGTATPSQLTPSESIPIQQAQYRGSGERIKKVLFGKQTEKIQPIYFGGTEILSNQKPTPTYKDPFTGESIGGTETFTTFQPITPDYSRSLTRQVEEYLFPAASIPLTMGGEKVYLPDTESTEKFSKLIKPDKMYLGTESKEYLKFIRDQQAQYKKDLGEYNVLVTLKDQGISFDKLKQRRFLDLERRLKIGQRGTTLKDITYEATRDTSKGRRLYDTLVGGQYAYSAGKIALAFELGLGGLGVAGKTLGIALPKITGTASQLNWLKGASTASGIALGTSFATMGAAQEYSQKGDISSSIAAGIGTGVGLFGGQLISKVTTIRPPTFEEKLILSQQRVAKMEKDIGKIQQKRFNLLRGETGVDQFGVPLKPSAQFDAMALTSSQKITRAEARILYDYLDDMNLVKNIPKKTFLKDASVSVGSLRTSLPERIGTMKGSLGDLPGVLELGKFSDDLAFIGKGRADIRELALGIQAKTGKQLKVVYQVDKLGKPIKSTIELQVVTSGKGQKYSIIEPFTKGRKSKSIIKTDAGDFILYKESPIRVGEPYTARTLKSSQVGDEALKIRTSEIEFRQLDPLKKPISGGTPEEIMLSLQSQRTNKEIAELFKKGKKIQKEYLLDIIKKGKTDYTAEISYMGYKDLGIGKSTLDKIDDSLMISRLKTKGYSPLGIDTKAIDKALKTSVAPSRSVRGFTETVDDSLKLKLELKQIKEPLTLSPPRKVKITPIPTTKIEVTTKPTTKIDLISPQIFRGSAYAGTGQYELTGDVMSPKFTSDIISPRTDSFSSYSRIDIKQESITNNFLSSGLKVNLGMGLEIKQLQGQELGLDRRTIQEPLSISKTKQASLLDSKIAQQLKSLQQLKTEQISKTKQVDRTTLVTTPRPTTPRPKPRPPKPKNFWIPLTSRPKKRKLIKKPKEKEVEFLAITKRYGKEKIIAKGKDLTKIISVGKQKVKGTLGATLKVKTVKGKQIKLTPSKTFRVSKTDPLAIVQRKTKRLASPGERREIKKTRKKPFSLK